MKFISKNSNLNIILRPGQQAQPITGTPAVSALSVRFQNGLADIHEENMVEMMLRHPGFNQDFIAVDETGTDPYAHLRAGSEPQHVTTELKYGHPVARSAPPVSTQLPPEIKKLITEQATAIAAEMVKAQMPDLMAEAIKAVMAVQTGESPKTVTSDDPVSTEAEVGEKAVASAVAKPKTKPAK